MFIRRSSFWVPSFAILPGSINFSSNYPLFSTFSSTSMPSVKEGDMAPLFALPDQDGKEVKLESFRGHKNVVLYFYPQDATSGCTKQACSFRDSLAAFSSLDAEILGISSDSVESHKKFADNQGLTFRLLADGGSNVRRLYGVPKSAFVIPGRVTYVIDKKGIIRNVFNSMMNVGEHISTARAALESISKNEK